jgi:hypothetical protein
MTGAHITFEGRSKLRDDALEAWGDPQKRARLVAGIRKSRTDPGFLSKMGRAKGRVMGPEARETNRLAQRRRMIDKPLSPSALAKISVAAKAMWNDPVKRAARCEAIRAGIRRKKIL